METLPVRDVRRLALARAGLLKPEWTNLPKSARGTGPSARQAAHQIIGRFGYLQLDTVSIAGARSHALVLMSRLHGLTPSLGEDLLRPGEPLFEYWGHEASWLPLDLYPVFEFRRHAFKVHPWWGDVIRENKRVAERLRERIRKDGPLRSVDMEGQSSSGWWDFKIAKRVATALWSSGELAIRQRKNFIRTYDLAERVIPATVRGAGLDRDEAIRTLLLRALDGHGWATKGTLAATWRLRNLAKPIASALADLESAGEVVGCSLEREGEKPVAGWIRPRDLELAARLRRVRSFGTEATLLSPFDPLLWDRARVATLFGFDQVLEIFKPAAQRKYGYYCLPVLLGERLIARVDPKADRKNSELRVLTTIFEAKRPSKADRAATERAIKSFAKALGFVVASHKQSG